MPATPHEDGRARTHAPYADALAKAAARNPLLLQTPGHGGNGDGISAGQADFFGENVLALDIPPLFDGIDLGVDTPKDEALELAAEAWEPAARGSSPTAPHRANRMAALAIGTLGSGVVTQRSAHSSFIDGIVLAGLNPRFVSPNVDEVNGIAHGVTPDSLRHAIRSHRRRSRPSTSSPRATSVRSRTSQPSPRWPTRPARSSSSTRPGVRTSASTPTFLPPRSRSAPTSSS